RLRQAQARLGDRSLTLPEETDLRVDVRAGTLATSGLGRATLDLGWDMHERSPVLRRGRRATEIWVPELRTNAFTLQVSPSGGLAIEGPPGGLYDARFFNALLNPGQELRRWLEVLDSDDAVDRIIASVRILSDSAAELLEVLRRMARRVRTVVDEEGLREPRDVIPAARIARVLTRLLDGDAALEDRILPLVRQVVAGQGLDVPRVKALLLETLPDQPFEFEVDRLLRWLSRVLAPMDPEPAFPVRDGGLPLAEDPRFTDRFRSLPPAAELYARIAGKGPLPASFSGLLARLSPWLAPGQLSWVLDRRGQELPPPVRDRLLHVLDIKRRIARIEEGYGGVSYAPQAVAISFFLGDTIAMGTLPCPAADGLDLPEDLIPHGLLGPRDVAVLLQSGLAAAWTGRTVQLNQRLLLDMLDRMPSLFLHGVLMEMGESNPRVLAGILLALLDMEQGKLRTPVDLVAFFSERLGIPFPRRSDYMAGGRWARLSYYEALMHTAERVVDEGSTYRALKYYLQEARGPARPPLRETARLRSLCDRARRAIAEADAAGASWTSRRREGRTQRRAAAAFQAAFEACATLRDRDPRAFSLPFFKAFWARNFEALMVRSVVRNAQEDVDQVRSWLGARDGRPVEEAEQALVEQVVRVLYWHEADRRTILEDPLTRLLLDPPAGRWQLTVVSCMGVITEGARGVELAEAYGRLEALRGV
ncbi:MAG: hypothetical protein FJ098_13760, partial [Deltaproteobacteria bacterium]|nr:hypothetical protein [Deltaproteobacteria bacterium]